MKLLLFLLALLVLPLLVLGLLAALVGAMLHLMGLWLGGPSDNDKKDS